jgi:hypothetical protein
MPPKARSTKREFCRNCGQEIEEVAYEWQHVGSHKYVCDRKERGLQLVAEPHERMAR